METERGFLYTMIRRVASCDPRTDDIGRFLEILADNLAEGRREHTFLRDCRLCDVGVIRRPRYTELRYYMWCQPDAD